MDVKIALIVAQSQNRVIGRDGDMPWHLTEDLKFFKRTTMGKPIVMGRKTFASIGKPLPGRANIVITRDPDFKFEGVVIARSLEEGISMGRDAAKESGVEEVMVIGGGEIYRGAMAQADRVYLTQVHAEVSGETFFPEIDPSQWREAERSEVQVDQASGLEFTWMTWDRK
jgi:dihydrofolate reductase